MKKYIYLLISTLILTSCSDFLDRNPSDALSPSTFWKTEADAKLALTGCYRGFEDSWALWYRDCATDNAYNNHSHEGYMELGNGTMTPGNPGKMKVFEYITIRRCNEFLENIDNVEFTTDGLKKSYVAEVRFLRAYRYFLLTQYYGDTPLVTQTFNTPDESKVPRDPRATVEEFIVNELKELTLDLLENPETGRIPRDAGYALLTRMYLFKGMYSEAISAARQVRERTLIGYEDLFRMENKDTDEVIYAYQHVKGDLGNSVGAFYPNSSGGWSSVIPLQSLVDAYEMADGKTIEEAKAAGEYDEKNPYVNRDPRLRATIVYPGQNWNNIVYRSVEESSPDYPKSANNATSTGYNFRKYFGNGEEFDDIWDASRTIFMFRYAEVLLSLAEAKIELNQIDNDMYNAIDKVRTRAGMPAVDRTKYANQTKLRELIRRERRVEFAFEGLRRFDIVRWGIAKDVMNGDALGCRQGTVLDETYPNGDHKVNLDGANFFVESRKFEDKHNLFPIPQTAIDKNPNLLPNNPGY
ncbi:hypothetical protein M2451_002294 [Dysgonomonas sp. PFB1-18]|uniref:RagB/SusD family nutrient uptake outer membrane protein n=1 Tax=unclassified Dysgonomonas TaxID=2630389 RepID=UPI0024732B51|nr:MULTISPECIES: RagB/SusD family nutrient uptake outer membrane protein [unclassified Dysgonomonas]MDL2303214.1 RagB/SusD family nutrient uptake outer membrane protein [Dysgonomonas sp. OttesenSCG-928-D17]MDH6309922.1 hypothetical protein [Dysgonomonas sp. PF1-14]MDH6339466.1 hypothetical protein [Dysgonomonas sp. PF1-16]MDH6380966.1 hypothetical protein [Dysgonomonas sp. PFB1-18]MDH6397975.1 hypothetical protein [Dysgonomonas sp. PF1-23]